MNKIDPFDIALRPAQCQSRAKPRDAQGQPRAVRQAHDASNGAEQSRSASSAQKDAARRGVDESFIFAGHGGQGVISIGKFLAYVAMNAGCNVTWIPSYGAEVRGGTAHSMVRIRSSGPIANPLVTEPSILVAMNAPSVDRFSGKVKKGGLMIVDNTDMAQVKGPKGITVKSAPFTRIASGLGNKRVANTVILGAMMKIKPLFSLDKLAQCLPPMFPNRPELVELNRKAIETGYRILLN